MLNRTIIQGRFVKKPEALDKGGFKLCDFTLAWSEKYKDTEKKCFVRCKAWRSNAEFVEKYFDKGQECVVEGQLSTEEWEKDGQKQSMNVLNVEKVHFCGPKGSSTAPDHKPVSANEDFMNIPDNIDEEIPFS